MSGISVGSITTYERDGRVTRGSNGVSGNDQLAAIQATLEVAGIVFTKQDEAGPGVRMQKSAGAV